MAHEDEPAIRPEWQELDAIPARPCCPFVLDIDIASETIVQARDGGYISEDVAAQRLKVLDMRRIIVAKAQQAYPCPLATAEGAEADCEAGGNCTLPIGRIEALSFGNTHDGILNAIMAHKGNAGF